MVKWNAIHVTTLAGLLFKLSFCYVPFKPPLVEHRTLTSQLVSSRRTFGSAISEGNARRQLCLSMISSPRNMDDQDYETSRLEGTHDKDIVAVKRQTIEFYNAFTSKNFDEMQRLWLQTPYIQCILPGLPFPVNGYESIMEMWKTVFGASDDAFSSTVIKPSSMVVQIRGKIALVFCNEDVVNGRFSRQMHATNIYRKMGKEWLMVHHHVSPSADSMLRSEWTVRQPQSDFDEAPQHLTKEEQPFASLHTDEEELYTSEESGYETSTMIRDIPAKPTESSSQQVPTGFHCLHPSVTDGAILAVKELSNAGRLSSKDRTLLFQDIVSHHNKGMEASRTEIAYELLVARFLGSK
mmetsp:Transcript_11591/g.39986  ORF Transcript_11591/g.39986 Transcript_11591/m.39986 type:complete len:352 (+) Transcript_11591:247-1302(+)